MLIGTPQSIAKKLNLSDYLTRTYLNYGLKNGLIYKSKENYILTGYEKIIDHIRVITYKKYYHFKKTGTFKELIDDILLTIAKVNFKRQKYHIDQRTKLKRNYLRTVKRQQIENEYSRVGRENINSIVTGQKHLAKVLGISSKKANNLLIEWDMSRKIVRRKIFQTISSVKNKAFYKNITNNYGYCLNYRGYSICKGSAVVAL